MQKRYTIKTILGYFLLGVLSFVAGSLYSNWDAPEKFIILLKDNIFVIAMSLIGSSLFYFAFFHIRENIDKIVLLNGRNDDILNEEELLSLGDKYHELMKKKPNHAGISEKDITESGLDDKSQCALKIFLGQSNVKWILVTYFFLFVVFTAFFVQFELNAVFFVTYTLLFLFSTSFYSRLFLSLRLETFIRLSYCILYPTVLTIAVNFYFGLSIAQLTNNIFQPAYISVLIFAFFFVFSAICECFSYIFKNQIKSFSTGSFVIISLFVLFGSIILFYISSHTESDLVFLQQSLANLLFSIAIALYLGIYEGWDSLRNMNICKDTPRFMGHYRWWNFLQICYPLAFFFIVAVVDSEIFTFGLIVSFSIVSFMSTIIWKKGGEKSHYSETRWGMWKFIFGLITIAIVYINKLLFMNDFLGLKNSPPELNTDNISVELVVFLLGIISTLFTRYAEEKQTAEQILLAVPFYKDVQIKQFNNFCKYGFLYDFTNYLYLIYILVAHVLLFSTGLINLASKQTESATIISLLLMVIANMFLSFKAKITLSKSS